MTNLTQRPWWQPQPPQPDTAPTTEPEPATITPEQIILAALKGGHPFTLGNLYDLCRQSGVPVSYAALRTHLLQLQGQGKLRSGFDDRILPGLSVLTYYRP